MTNCTSYVTQTCACKPTIKITCLLSLIKGKTHFWQGGNLRPQKYIIIICKFGLIIYLLTIPFSIPLMDGLLLASQDTKLSAKHEILSRSSDR